MDPLMNPYIAHKYADAFRQERMHDAGDYRIGRPSMTLRLVAGFASALESISSRIRRWSQPQSTNEVAASRWTPSAR